MSDNLIFPIGFDLDKAVEQAGKDWDGKFADKLEKLIAKRPVNVKLKLDTKNLDSLDAVKKRLAELRIEPITPETKSAIKELTSELRQLAKALEQVQKYSKNPTKGAVDASRVALNEEKAKAQAALAAQRASKAEDNLAAARLKDARAANVGAAATRNASKAYHEQSGYLQRLTQRMAAYWSIRQVGNFLTSVRDVTAEFELQRVSLGAIIQDQQRANALFSEIKSFALKSPVSIMDLTKYTKQLAAYKIETEELFETTKKLTDVSVGLGVSLDRVILAYGQTRATGYLRASEIRQFTEMGVPIVEELAAKLSKMNGELVTAAQVMDMVSKRGISFELVKEVFDDMTSAGGMFYNMQEKQGNTLFGMWAKLGDAASVMYDEIGNTEWVNKGMKDLIQLLTDLMKNWRLVGGEIAVAGIAIGFIVARTKAQAATTALQAAALNKVRTAGIAYNAILAEEARLQKIGTAAQLQSVAARKANAKAALDAAVAERTAANATNIWTRSLNKLKAALMGNWITLLITAVASLGVYIYNAVEKANRLKNTLSDIGTETSVEISRMVTNFESLAKKAVEAADGSREQKDALSELQRTYRNIIPEQNLTIEKLREMKGEYSNLTIAIREYIREQQLQKGLNTIMEKYGSELVEAERNFKKTLGSKALSLKDGSFLWLNTGQIDRIVEEFKTLVREGKSAQEALKVAFDNEGINNLSESFEDLAVRFGLFKKELIKPIGYGGLGPSIVTKIIAGSDGLTKAIQDEEKAIADFNKQMEETVPGVGNLTKFLDEAKKTIEETPIKAKPFTFDYDIEKTKVQIDAYYKALQDALDFSGVNIDLSKYITLDPKGIKHIDFTGFSKELDGVDSEFKTRLQRLTENVQNVYNGLIPSDRTVASLINKLEQLSDKTGASMDVMRRYQMKSGESWADYSKRVEDEIKSYEDSIAKMEKSNKAVASGENTVLEFYSKEEIAKANTEMKTLIALLDYLKKSESNGGGGSDPRLGILNEMASTLKQINKEYDDLQKKEGSTKALKDMQRTYADTFKNMQALAKQYKFDLPGFGVPTDTVTLTEYLDAIKKAMAKLSKSDKAVLSLQVDIDKLNIDEKQKQIDEQLKVLADRVSRTKTAQEFYDKILSTTGDIDLAASVTMSIYGDVGSGLFDAVVSQIQETFKTENIEVDAQIGIDLQGVIDTENERINYAELARIYDKYQDQIIAKNRNTAENIIKEGQKTAASNIAMWEKELAKAKDYEEQRTDIINRETQRRAEIYKSNLPQEEKDRLAAQSQRKQDEDLAKVNFEEFTKSEDYIKIFENLDNVATSSLKRLRAEMQALIDTNQNLSPENMKTLVKAMEDIDEQISGRGFGNDMVQSVNDYINSIKNLKIAKQELAKAEAEYQAQLPQLDENIALAEAEKVEAQRVLNELKNDEFATENEIVTAELRLNTATANVAKAQQAKAKAADKVKKAEQKVTGEQDKQKKATTKFVKDLQKVASTADQLAGELSEIKDLLGISEDSAAGLVFDSAIEGLQQMSNLIGIVTAAQMLYNVVTESNPWMAIAAAVLAVISALSFGIGAAKVRKANKEIERQQDLLDQLEYTYGRLEKAADKAFGRDYVNNYQQQIKNLQAQQAASLKQAEAERSKGKKKDKEKIKEYENQARETADKIKELQDDLVAHFTGSSKTDVARQMAKSWIDARASMSDTFAAIKGDYQDLIKNMIVEGAAARVIENALTPIWDKMDKMLKDNNINGAIDALVSGMDSALNDANNGMEVLWKALEARGYDMKQLIGDTDSKYTGIAKNIAGATSEEINNVAAIGNTLMYYVSPIPRIDENLARVVALMEGRGASAIPQTSSAGWTDWQQQAMDNYIAIQRNTADTVIECRRAAEACEKMTTMLGHVIRPAGSKSIYSISTTLN